MINDKNYFLVSGWMINRLHLRGNELCVYAIIYGFTQDGESWFEGSRQYLAEFTGASKSAIDNVLVRLVEKGLVEKKEVFVNRVKFNHYRTVPLPESGTPPSQKQGHPLPESVTNNIEDKKQYVSKGTPQPPIVNKSEFYPRSVEEVLALSKTPMCGLPCTNEVAEAYFIDRVRKDWTINGQFKQIPPGAVALDLKAWLMRDREKAKAAQNTRTKGEFQDGKHMPDRSDYAADDDHYF